MNPTCFFVCQIHPHSTSFLLVDMKQPTWCSSNFFQPINRGLGPLIGHMLFRYGYRGVPMRIQIRNIFACLLSLWFEKKLNIRCQALFKTPNYKVWTWKIKLALWKVTQSLGDFGWLSIRVCSAVSVKIGPASGKGNPLEWRSCLKSADVMGYDSQ